MEPTIDWSPPIPVSEKHDINSLKYKLIETSKFSDILFANIRSLRSNFNDLIELIELLNHKFTAIILNETWLEIDEHYLFNIEGYDTYSVPRNKYGGGVLIYIKQSLSTSQINPLSFISSTFESLFITVNINSVQLTIGTVYRPPNNSRNLTAFHEEFKTSILNKLPSNDAIICGDFNLDLHSNSSNQINHFVTDMSSHGFSNSITQSTRIHYDEYGNILSSTLIDHIWSTLPNIEFSFVLDYQLTDHFPIGCVLNIPRSNDLKIIRKRQISDQKIKGFQEEFMEFYNNFKIQGSVHEIFLLVYITLVKLISKHFPITSEICKMKKLKRPWIDKKLEKLISKKHLIYRKCKMGLIPFSRFKIYRNLLNKTLNLAKKLYYKNKFSEINSDPKATWKLINDVMNPGKADKKLKIKDGDSLISNISTLTNKFNSFYLIESNQNSGSSRFNSSIDMNPNSFFLKPISPAEVSNILYSMKNNSIFSDLPIKVLKFLHEPFCVLLSDLFNYAITNNVFPDILKNGTIKPILKKGDPKKITNYRPITLLNAISKIFDKILYHRVYDFFEKFNLFSKTQFGFMKMKGTEQATLNLLYNINQAFLKNEFCAAIFVDLSKAFDKVNLDKLLQKLYKYGIRGSTLSFFESYLKNRVIRTKLFDPDSCNEIFSDPLTSNLGVAQESNLGPLLFNIYINNMESVFKNCKLIVYADDILVFKSSSNLSDLKLSLETELHNLYEYITDLDQNMNMSKTKAMIFSRKRNFSLDITLNNNKIELVNEFKYLGLTIDNKLTFKSHIKNVTTKVNQANGRLFYLNKFLPIYHLKKIFYSLIYSHLNLHILAWGGSCASNINPLIVAVNKSIRNIYLSDDPTEIKYKKLNILSVPQIYNLRLGEFFFKTINLHQQQLLADILNDISFEHSYNTRYYRDFRIPQSLTDFNKRFFINNGIKFWRTLPNEIKSSETLPEFRNKIKQSFLHINTNN